MANTGTVASLSCAPWSAASHAAHTAARRPVHTGGVADVYLAVFKPSASLAGIPKYRSHRGPAPVGLRRVHADQGR